MNYAEDRLDRRVSGMTMTPSSSSSSSSSPEGEGAEEEATVEESSSDKTTTTPGRWEEADGRCHRDGDDTECDLARARAVFSSHASRRRRRSRRHRPPPSPRELREAHELTGRALRDCGRNGNAAFHFGMAWRVSHRMRRDATAAALVAERGTGGGGGEGSNPMEEEEEEWEWTRSVGDYAQMCELAGFPELGILALLFHRAGGCPSDDKDDDVLNREDDSNDDDDYDDDEKTTRRQQQRLCGSGCGCGLVGCGESPCFVAFPTRSSVLDEVLGALEGIPPSSIGAGEHFPSALDVLARLARAIGRSGDGGGEGPVAEMRAFLIERGAMRDVPSVLRFWEDSGLRDNEDDDDDDRGRRRRRRILPPVVQLLLLKLLYSSPISGPCLQLACLAVPHLAARFPPSSAEGKTLARAYKSHWAYYVLVRSLVLGERTKGHRERHHVPVWDVVFGLPDDCPVGPTTRTEEEKKKDGDVCSPIDCGDRFRAILRFAMSASPSPSRERSEAGCDESANDDDAPLRRSMPRVALGGLSSLMSHPPIFFVGDSHVLSMAWQTLCIDPSKARTGNDDAPPLHGMPVFRTAVPFPVTGMKAWHVRPSTRFFTNYNLRAFLDRLPRACGDSSRAMTVIFSAGEIDCREGIGGSLLQSYYCDCRDAVRRTVTEYLTSLSDLAREYRLQVLVMPVAPHAYRSEKNGKLTGRARRRETTHLWNETLRRDLDGGGGVGTSLHSANRVGRGYDGVYLLDYERRLRQRDANSPVGYVLHPRFNADYTHVNSAIAPLVEDAILHCGCNLTLL